MITLHHLNNSRSQRILWLMEELGLEYQIQFYERDPVTIFAPKSLEKVHPLGKSPVIVDSDNAELADTPIAESGAIIEYLVEQYGAQLKPSMAQAIIQYRYWMHYAEGSLMPPLLMNLVFNKMKTAPMPFFIKPIARMLADKVVSSFVGPNIKRHLRFIDAHLAQQPWMCGETFSAADIQMSFPLEASVARGLINETYPNILDYVKRFQQRPAYQAALKAGGEYDYA